MRVASSEFAAAYQLTATDLGITLTIGGEFSLKSRKENAPDIICRSVPATLQFEPNTKYRVSFDYLCDNAGFFTSFLSPVRTTILEQESSLSRVCQ